MEESSGRPPVGGVARRRRERRLRSMLRHEQQSIRMALATVMHHSFKVHTEYGAPRSQITATRAREGEVHERHDGLRAQERPLPGTRPAPLLEVLPQVGGTAAHRGPDRRRRSWVTDARWCCAAYGGTAGGRAPAI